MGMFIIDREKMLKLFGNFFSICYMFDLYDVESLCYFFLIVYYCSLFDYSIDNLNLVCLVLECLYMVLCGCDLMVFVKGGE